MSSSAGNELWLSGPQHVCGRPPSIALPERIPLVRVGNVQVQLVDVVGPVDQLPLVVVQRDEEVLRVHQLAHDRVHRRVELLHVAGRARELRDPVEGVLNLRVVPGLGHATE
jgi:hypothetical protein